MPNPCTIPGCPKPAYARGLCQMHLSRNRRGSKQAKVAESVVTGDRTATVIVHCSPDLKKTIKGLAKKRGVTVSTEATRLLRVGLCRSEIFWHQRACATCRIEEDAD